MENSIEYIIEFNEKSAIVEANFLPREGDDVYIGYNIQTFGDPEVEGFDDGDLERNYRVCRVTHSIELAEKINERNPEDLDYKAKSKALPRVLVDRTENFR